MSKFMSLKKQIENKSKNWFLKMQKEENKELAKNWFEENKKEVIEEYLQKHPKVNEEYKSKKKTLNKVKFGLATAGIIATTIVGASCITRNNTMPDSELPIGQETDTDKNIDENEEEGYATFFEEIAENNNTEKREDAITNQTKQIIIEAYNQRNPDNPITQDRLETLILNEYVLEKKDKLGNCTYERVSQKEQIEQNDNQRLVRIGEIYDFRIDGKSVAAFDKNGQYLINENVENPDMEFKKSIEIVKKSEELKDVYKYPSNDNEKRAAEQRYEEETNKLLQKDEKINTQKVETEQRDNK